MKVPKIARLYYATLCALYKQITLFYNLSVKILHFIAR